MRTTETNKKISKQKKQSKEAQKEEKQKRYYYRCFNPLLTKN